MQVYRDLRIITARPSPAEERRAPHRLYGRVDAAENYSVGRWCTDAAATLATTKNYGRAAIVVGGTGLYFKALTQGIAAVPPFRRRCARRCGRGSPPKASPRCTANLKRRDPVAAARLMPGDRSRITRALEVVLATGRSLLEWHAENRPAGLDAGARGQNLPRARTRGAASPHRRAVRRHDRGRRARGGARAGAAPSRSDAACDEGPRRALAASGISAAISRSRRPIEGGKRDTRQYTKRQATWFRNQLPEFAWVAPEQAVEAAEAQLRQLAQ